MFAVVSIVVEVVIALNPFPGATTAIVAAFTVAGLGVLACVALVVFALRSSE